MAATSFLICSRALHVQPKKKSTDEQNYADIYSFLAVSTFQIPFQWCLEKKKSVFNSHTTTTQQTHNNNKKRLKISETEFIGTAFSLQNRLRKNPYPRVTLTQSKKFPQKSLKNTAD